MGATRIMTSFSAAILASMKGGQWQQALSMGYRRPARAVMTYGPPTPAASLRSKWREFADCVAIDTFELADAQAVNKTFLNMVDMASRYQIVKPVASRSPKVIWEAFLDGWLSPLGIPLAVMADMGGEFEREVKEELESMGCRVLASAPYSPTQNAICERHSVVRWSWQC